VAQTLEYWLPSVLPDLFHASSAPEIDRFAAPGIVAVDRAVAGAPIPDVLAMFTSKEARAATPSNTIDAAIERLAQQLAEGHTQEFFDLIAFYGRF